MAVKTFDDCLASYRPEQRAALEKLRKVIRAAAPKAEEGVNYGLAAFLLNGKPLAGLGASKNHCSYFPMTGHTVEQFKDDLKDFETSKGTIRFTPDKPLPTTLVRKIVKARIVEIKGATAKTVKPKAAHPKKVAKSASDDSKTDPAVTAYLAALKHPLKQELEAVRQLILGVSPAVREGIKWNSPSFRTTDWFATVNVHGQDGLRLILHTGAKVKATATEGLIIPDPTGLLKWLAKDRAMVTLTGGKDLAKQCAALKGVLRGWVKGV